MTTTIDQLEIIKHFVTTFITKSKRERAKFELSNKRERFLGRLNHQITDSFIENKLKPVHPCTAIELAKKLNVTERTLCYIISHNSLDDQTVEFSTAFNSLRGNGLGFCIIPIGCERIYLETEQEIGSSTCFIGV